MIKVIDLYSGNPRDFTEALNGTFSGVIFKGGQGDWLDVPKIQPDWWKIAGDEGLLRGHYWVCDSRYHSSKHIDTINRWRDDWKIDLNAELGFWHDLEYPYISCTTEEYWRTPYAGYKNVVDFHYLMEVNEINAGLYSGDVFNEIMKHASSADLDYLAKFRMWAANYPDVYIPGVSKPRMFGHWTKWTLWQYHGNPDYNTFNGTDEEFTKMFGVATPPEPPIGGDMYQGTVIIGIETPTQNVLNVRNAPSTGAVVGGLKYNDKVEADRVEAGWWHLTKIRGVATVGENWAYEGATKGYIRTDVTPPVAKLPVIHQQAIGYPDNVWSPL
jgi:hypothetical protein